MGLFRRKGPVVFEPYGYRRRRSWGVPRWLVLLLLGVAIGAGGLLYVQESHLPPRLSASESQQLLARLEEVDRERQRLQGELTAATSKVDANEAETRKLTGELGEARRQIDRLQKDLALFDEVLPPDPRGGDVEVRAARFSNDAGRLAYHVLLTRDRKGGKPFRGVMQLVVSGERASGRNDTVTLDPVDVTLASYQHVQGALALPEGFTARQTTIRVLDAANGRTMGMRVINVR